MSRKHEFTAVGKNAVNAAERKKFGPKFERVGVWTDGLMLASEHEPGWPPEFRLKIGKSYRVTIEELL